MVAKKRLKLIWSTKAEQSLERIYQHIKEKSPSAAIRVKSEIFKTTRNLSSFPEKYQLDEYYSNNPGNIRRFFRWTYRIIYEINEETIDILNVIHAGKDSDNP